MERVLCETFVGPAVYQTQMGIVKAREFGARSKIFLFSKTVQYGNISSDICQVMQAGRQGRLSLRDNYNLCG